MLIDGFKLSFLKTVVIISKRDRNMNKKKTKKENIFEATDIIKNKNVKWSEKKESLSEKSTIDSLI